MNAITLKIRRGGEKWNCQCRLAARQDAVYQISELPEASGIQRRIRNGILRGTTDSAK